MAGSGLVGDLVNILRGQVEIYTEILSLSLDKKDVIVKNDVDTLKKITGKENELIGKSQRLEKMRIGLIKDIAIVLNEKQSNITLNYLVDKIKGQPEADEMAKTASELRGILNKLKEANDQNKQLIQNSLDYIDFSINVIRSTAGDGPEFSSPYGERISTSKGFFDAKQ